MSIRVAVLDDYQDVALKMTDWSVLPSDVQVQVFRDHLADPQEVAQRLRGFEIVIAMRERTPFPRRLPRRASPAQIAHYDRHAQCLYRR